jgi:predicted MFS family arabinose efflux permease
MGVGSGLGVFLAGRVIDTYGVRQIWIVNLVLGLVGVMTLTVIFRQVRPEQE